MIFIFLNFKSIKKHWALFSVSTGSLIFLFKNPILESLSTRFPIFDISFQMILDYPFGVNLLGLNILTSNYISKINYNSEQSLNVFYDFSHNLVLDVLVWAGIIGFLFLIALSYRMIKNFLQDKHLILLFLTFIPIVSLSILSSVEWVVLTFYFALIFPDSKNKLKTISIDFRLISFFLLIFFVLISRSVIGDSYYSKFQLSNNKIYLEQSLKHNPTNLNATMQTMNFLNKPDLNKFYQIAQNVHGKNNLALYRSYLKALAFNGENIENEAIKLTEINSHDYKNWLLINNFYKLTNQKEKEEQSIPKLTSNLPEINIDIINNSPDIYWNLKKYLE